MHEYILGLVALSKLFTLLNKLRFNWTVNSRYVESQEKHDEV